MCRIVLYNIAKTLDDADFALKNAELNSNEINDVQKELKKTDNIF